MTLKFFFGILSIIPAVIAYYIYFKNMFTGRTKPHAFSWLVWGLLAGNGFLIQVSGHAGIGAWATGLTSVASLAIFFYAIRKGASYASRFDVTLLVLALGSLCMLLVVKNEHVSLWLTLVALASGFVMTGRKAYRLPHEENAMSFFLNTLKFIPAIFALQQFSFLTVAYPLVATMGNAAVAAIVYVGLRRQGIIKGYDRSKSPHQAVPQKASR